MSVIKSIKVVSKFSVGVVSVGLGYADAGLDGVAGSIENATHGGVVERVASRGARANFQAGHAVGSVHYAVIADGVQEYGIDVVKSGFAAVADAFAPASDVKPVSPLKNGGLGGFGA